MKVNINGSGHVTKMAAMVIKSKNHYKFYFQNRKAYYDSETLPEWSSTKFI